MPKQRLLEKIYKQNSNIFALNKIENNMFSSDY